LSGPRLLTRGFLAVLVTQSMYGYSASSFFLLPKYLATELDAGPVPIGAVTALYGLASVVLMPLAGAWVDRFGRLGFMRAGILLQVFASAGFLLVEELGPLVYVLRTLQGFAWALTFAGAGAVVTDHAPPQRMAQALGLFGLSMLSMNAIAPAATEEIAARVGWGGAFLLAAAAAAVSLLLSATIRERHTPPDDETGTSRLRDVVLRRRSLWWMAIIATNGAAFGAMFTFSQPFALELGMENVRGFFIAYTAAAIAVRVGLGPLADRAGRKRVSLVSGLLYAAAVFWMAALEPPLLAWIGAAFGMAHGLFYPAFNALALEDALAHERGKFVALFNASFNAGWAAGGVGLGLLAEQAGYGPVFSVAGAVVLVGVAALALPVGLTRPQT